MKCSTDKDTEGPLYLRLAQEIRQKIAEGELKPGERLPTVRALFQKTGISDGTIRHAYELLAREGMVSVIQGKGTFVNHNGKQDSRRIAQAMQAIDHMLDELTALGMSSREIQMYLNVKMSQREEHITMTRVAVVDCNSESLNEIALQLSGMRGVEVSEYLLEDIRNNPVQILEDFPLVVTTQTHYYELLALLQNAPPKVVRIALSASPQTVLRLAGIELDNRVGIYSRSERFAEIVRNGLLMLSHLSQDNVSCMQEGKGVLAEFLRNLQTLLVAPDYLNYAGDAELEALSEFQRNGGNVIEYHHQLDQGSLLIMDQCLKDIAMNIG